LQEISDSLPSSRFSHLKSSILNVQIKDFSFRTFPDTCSPSEAHRKNVLFHLKSWSIRIESKFDSRTKQYKVSAEEFDMQSDMLVDVLAQSSRTEIIPTEREKHLLQLGKRSGFGFLEEDEVIYTGSKWAMPMMQVHFSLSPSSMRIDRYSCHAVNIDVFDEKLHSNSIGAWVRIGYHSHPFLRTSAASVLWCVVIVAINISLLVTQNFYFAQFRSGPTGKIIDAKFEEAHVYAGMSAVVKVLRTQTSIKNMVDRCLLEMAKTKYFPSSPPVPLPQESGTTSVLFDRLHVDFPISQHCDFDPALGVSSAPVLDQIMLKFGQFRAIFDDCNNSTTYAWRIADFLSNGHDRPFFHAEDFIFTSLKPNAAETNYAVMNVGAEKIAVRLMADGELDLIQLGLLSQYESWKTAMMPALIRKKHNDGHTPIEPITPLEIITKSEPFVANLCVTNSFSIEFDASIQNPASDAELVKQKIVVPGFLTFSLEHLELRLDSSADEVECCRKIHAADVSVFICVTSFNDNSFLFFSFLFDFPLGFFEC
jgi:hypothetical protein